MRRFDHRYHKRDLDSSRSACHRKSFGSIGSLLRHILANRRSLLYRYSAWNGEIREVNTMNRWINNNKNMVIYPFFVTGLREGSITTKNKDSIKCSQACSTGGPSHFGEIEIVFVSLWASLFERVMNEDITGLSHVQKNNRLDFSLYTRGRDLAVSSVENNGM